MAVKTSKAGSIKALRASVATKGGGNEAFLQRIPADDSVTVRFLTEPEEWQSYFEHYDQVLRYFPCSDNCPACTEGNRPTQKYLANVLDVENNRVLPMVLPKSLVTKLLNSYDRYATMRDRDYELIRIGSGLDTDYDRSPEVPTKRNTKGVELLDLGEVLENQLKRAFDEGDDEEPQASKRPPAPRIRPKPKPAVADEDEDDDDEESKTPVDREELEDMSLRELRTYAKSELGIDPADIRGMDQDALVELILARSDEENYGSDPEIEPESEGEDNTPPKEETSDDQDAEDEAEEDSDEEDEELTADQVRAMTLPQLRKLCGQLEIPWKRTDGKNLLIKKVLESADMEEDDEPPF